MQRIVRRAGIIGLAPVALAATVGGGVLLARDDGADRLSGDTTQEWLSPFLVNQDPDDDVAGEEVRGLFAFDGMDGYLQKLAEKLGVSQEELEAAMKDAGLELLDEAVADGSISEENAERIREAIEEGKLPPIGGGAFLFPGEGGPFPAIGRHLGPFMFGLGLENHDELASWLGISEEQLREELNAGNTFAEVAEAHGKSRDELKQFLLDQHDARVQEAVDDGRLTEEQAADIRESAEEHVERMLDAQVRIHEGDGEPPEGFEGNFERRRGLFPPSGEDDESHDDDTTANQAY